MDFTSNKSNTKGFRNTVTLKILNVSLVCLVLDFASIVWSSNQNSSIEWIKQIGIQNKILNIDLF